MQEASEYDFVVLGGGSGGNAFTARVLQHQPDARILLIDDSPIGLGGTCVNVGCVPKKMFWFAGGVMKLCKEEAKHYGVNCSVPEFDWGYFKSRRDARIKGLNEYYTKRVSDNKGVRIVRGICAFDRLAADGKVVVIVKPFAVIDGHLKQTTNPADHYTVTCLRALIASGGWPTQSDVSSVNQFSITSNEFFGLQNQPKKAVVLGAGYIACELASCLAELGTEVHLVIRGEKVLRSFGDFISTNVTSNLEKVGVKLHRQYQVLEIFRPSDLNSSATARDVLSKEFTGKFSVKLERSSIATNSAELCGYSQPVITEADVVINAIGRKPKIAELNLDKIGARLTSTGYVKVSDTYETTCTNVFAIGDVIGVAELTPAAIAQGRTLASGLCKSSDMRYNILPPHAFLNPPTVVFTAPCAATVGMHREAALEKFGDENIQTYNSQAVNLYYSVFSIPAVEKPRILIQLVCLRPSQQIIGLQMVGMGVDEALQGFAAAVQMGATKFDFDRCLAIHPTMAEEVVTIAPWDPIAPLEPLQFLEPLDQLEAATGKN